MKAKVTKEFPGRPDGEALSRLIKIGEIITGDLAIVAIGEKWADEVADEAIVRELGEMTVAELKALAVKERVDLSGTKAKTSIVEAIEAARATKAE